MAAPEPAAPDPAAPDPHPVAVLGLGAMGLAMATRLARDFAVTGYDPSAESRTRAAARGLPLADTAAAAASGVAAVVVAVRTLDHAEQALFGPDGAVGAAPPVMLLTSTVGVPGARDLGERLAACGVLLLDAPVSGGPARAGHGDLLVFLGGSDEAVERAGPVVAALSSQAARVGSRPGDGQSVKVVNQLLCGAHIAAATEALALARSLGLDPADVLDVLGAGAAASFMLADRGPRIVAALAGETPEVRSRVDIFVKDMGIVLDAGRSAGVATPVAAAVEQLFRLAAAAGLAAHDDSTTVSLLS